MKRRAALALLIFFAGFAIGKWVPFGAAPKNEAERRYQANALEARAYLNDHPVSRLTTRLLVFQTSISRLRPVQGSCDGGTDGSLAGMTDMVATLHDRSFFGLPIARYETSCGGLHISRGSISGPAPAGGPPRSPIEAAPSPPPPPPPGA